MYLYKGKMDNVLDNIVSNYSLEKHTSAVLVL